MAALWIPLLLLTGGALSQKTCRFQDVLDHLDLRRNSDLFFMTRPVNDHRQPTVVSLEMCLYAILDVVEKDQKFIPYVWMVVKWQNDFISWNKEDFCGIERVSIPTEVLWKPDLTIEEMVEQDKAPHRPLLFISAGGEVELQRNQVLVSTCRMRVHKFPFDTQKCNLTFKSVLHTTKDIRLEASDNSTVTTEQSRDLMRTQYEWLFINITVSKVRTEEEQDMVIYTIKMKRRPLLYIVNFLCPVLFFLCLDLASFMITHGGGEKLTFKVTVLLAVTVLQLILNDILPASSDHIPLIALYCIGIFALMLLSLLETVVVMYLMKKDFHEERSEEKLDENAGCLPEESKDHGVFNIFSRDRTHSSYIYESSSAEMASATLEVDSLFQHNVSQLNEPGSKVSEECCSLEKVLDELKRVERSLFHLRRMHQEEPGQWTRFAKKLNRVFFFFYVAVVATFLVYIYIEWTSD